MTHQGDHQPWHVVRLHQLSQLLGVVRQVQGLGLRQGALTGERGDLGPDALHLTQEDLSADGVFLPSGMPQSSANVVP